MQSNVLKFEYQGLSLSYQKTGHGADWMLLFHGFGQDRTAFDELNKELGEKFTLLSIDLPFHGDSCWLHGEQPITKEFWREAVFQFLSHHAIEKFGLIGYSLGGKFALALLEAFPERVRGVYLIAPDGIKTNFWYALATGSRFTRSLFKSLITNQERFSGIVRFTLSLRFINSFVARFVESQMDTEDKRKKVYYSWVVFRQLKFDINAIASVINQNKIPLWLLMGKFDRIIKPNSVTPLVRKVTTCHHKTLETGHTRLITESAKELRNIAS